MWGKRFVLSILYLPLKWHLTLLIGCRRNQLSMFRLPALITAIHVGLLSLATSSRVFACGNCNFCLLFYLSDSIHQTLLGEHVLLSVFSNFIRGLKYVLMLNLGTLGFLKKNRTVQRIVLDLDLF